MSGRPAGLVVTSTAYGGAEKYLADVYGHPRVRAEFPATVIGDLPGWEGTGLPSVSVGAGTKWSRRQLPRNLLAVTSTRRRGRAALARFVQTEDPAFMHLQFKREQVLFSRPLAKDVPVIWTEHGGLPLFASWKAVAPAYRRAARATATIICVARHVADDIAALVGPGCPPLTVIEGGIDPDWMHPPTPQERLAARRRLGVPESATVVASVSRLVPAKRVELLLEAVATTRDLFALVCGEGPAMDALRAAAPPGRAVFTGFVPDHRDVYRAADVLGFPSGAREGFPFSLLEAASAGLPAVVVADAGLDGTVEGWGAAAAEATPECFADALRAALTAGTGGAARRWAEAHSLDRWIGRHLEVMRAVAR